MVGGDSASDGVPLLTRVLLVRASVRFDPSFPLDGVSCSPSSCRSPTTATTSSSARNGGVRPTLRVVAHYARGTAADNAGPRRSATSTPRDDAAFFDSHAALHQALTSMAADRLGEKVRLRQLQTHVAKTTVKLARVLTSSTTAVATTAAGGGRGKEAVASPDPASLFADSLSQVSSPSTKASLYVTKQEDNNNGGGSFHHGANRSDGLGDRGGVSGAAAHNAQVQGMLAAATATFAEDAAWRSLTTPHRPQLNPWCLTPIADEGCFLSVPTPAYVHWCELHCAQCCSKNNNNINNTSSGGGNSRAVGTAAPLSDTEPDAQGGGTMRYLDTLHYTSASAAGEAALHHGYAFLLDGAVFTGWDDNTSEDGPPSASTAAAGEKTPFRGDSGEMSVLLWCVLSDAPVFNFMRSVTMEAVAAMSYVAQRTYHETTSATASTRAVSASATTRMGTGVPVDVYTGLLESALRDEVVLPIARELLQPGTAASRAVPGESFTVSLPLARGRQSGVAARPQTSSMSGTLPFRRPLDLLFPCADVPLSTLLLSFGEDALRVLQSLMLQEERIVVIGATPQHASACVVSLPALIAPLLWVSPLVPYLPPHTAAQTGFLYTLLSTPYEMQQQQQQSSSPAVSRPATTASGSATQSSQHMESAGFLLGSTAAIRPYLMFLSSFGIAEAGAGGGGHRPRSGRAPRVWIADARSGAVGPCPTEPITPYFRVDRPLSTAEGSGGGGGGAAASTAAHNGKDAKDESCSGRSRSVQGGTSAWTLAAHLDLRLAAPHVFASSGGGGGGGTAQNPYVLYNAVRNTLRTAAEQNVMDAAPLDVLPPFQDELCDALRRVASADKRRQFRAALEDVAQHRRARVDGLESLAARLRRGLRHALAASAAAAAAAASATAGNSRGASGGMRASCVADTTDTDSDNDDGSDSDSGSDESSSGSSSSDVSDGEAMRRWDENASFHAVTQAVRPSSALGCADASATAASYSSSSSSPSVFAVAQFPSLPVSEVLQVQTGLLAYVVGRIVGAYRRGLSASSSGAATHRGSRRRYIQAPVFLVPGLDQHYTLAETVARTHLFRQFECTVLAAEAAGLRRTLSGEQLVASRVDSEHSGGGSDGRGVLRHINTLSMFALLLDRARLQFPDLYADHPSLDALGTVYASLVKHCFQHRPGTPAPPSVPPTIRVIAGGGPSTVSNSNGGGNGGGGGVSSSNSGGGGGGGFKNFLNKAAKAMKLHSSSGSGGGLGGGGGGWGGGGGGRRLPVVYVPASVACMTSFIVPPFSAQNVAPPSFPMLAPAPAGTTGYTTIHDVRAQERRHHHQRGLRRHHHDENDNTGKKEKKKKKKKQSKRRGKHRGSELYAVIPSAPRRQQWARQQQHQQRSALDMDFTLDDCTTVVRNHHVPGGVSGSLSSSFSASTGAAVAAAAAARAAAGAGGGFPTNATNSTVNSSGSGAYSGGAGIDAEVLTALAHAGGARGGGGSEATRRVMAEASLSICHALPLDLVHQFDAYEHLLAPLCTPSTTASVSAEAKAEADELSGPVAFMRVGLCCPTCVNVWREGEARAIHTLQQQQEEERHQYRHPQQQQQAQRHSAPSPSPSLFGNTSSSPLPPMPAKTGSLSTPQEVQLWSTPPPTTPHPSRVVPDAFAGTPAVMEDTASSWGAFTSGAPQGYPVDAMMSLDYPTQSLPRPDRTVGGAATSTPCAASPVVSSTRMTGTPASAFAPSPPMPQMNAHQDVWDSWGVQAPVVENTPTTAAPPAVMVGNYPNAATPTAPAASSLSVNGSSVNWTTTATSTPPMMVTTRMAEGGRGEGVFPPRLPPPLPLPQATSSSSSVSMARPLAAPAPGDVMDELFAGLSSYNNGASGSGSAAVQQQQQQQQQQPRRQTLDDFF